MVAKGVLWILRTGAHWLVVRYEHEPDDFRAFLRLAGALIAPRRLA